MRMAKNDSETLEIKRAVKKFGKNFKISNRNVNGTFTLTGFRNYNHYQEVEVEFNGTIFARIGRGGGKWYTYEDIKKINNISKIKLHKIGRAHV